MGSGGGAVTLLDGLPARERALIDARLERVDLPLGKVIHEPDAPISHVYFVASGIVSMVSPMKRGTVEVATVGREGMVGLPVLLHSDSTLTRAFVQVEGDGHRMPASALREAMAENAALERLLFRYAQSLFDQIAQTAACNRLHSSEERCAKWLLMARDRIDDDEMPLKQRFLAEMLGVHRPAVTLAAGALQQAGFIKYTRGRVRIVDRAGLESAACPCYAILKRSFDRMRAHDSRRV